MNEKKVNKILTIVQQLVNNLGAYESYGTR